MANTMQEFDQEGMGSIGNTFDCFFQNKDLNEYQTVRAENIKPADLYVLLESEVKAGLLLAALEFSEGNKSSTAELLGITRQTLGVYLIDLGLVNSDQEGKAIRKDEKNKQIDSNDLKNKISSKSPVIHLSTEVAKQAYDYAINVFGKGERINYKKTLLSAEQLLVGQIENYVGDNKSKVAKLLGKNRGTTTAHNYS